MKKMISLVLCILLLTACVLPVHAEETSIISDGDGSSTETGESGDTSTHTHIFDKLESNTATCGAAGTATYACACGEVNQVSSPATGDHKYGSFEYVDTSEHKRICSVCGHGEVGTHNWDSGRTIREANCVQEGEQVYTCTDCGGTYSRKIMKTGHHYDPSVSDDVYHVCGICQSMQSHAWDTGEVTRRPTCKESGTFEYYCSICQMTLVEPLAQLTTHTYDSACDPECNVCGKTRAIEHTFATAWSKNYKGHWHECTKCGEQKDFAAHDPGPEASEDAEQVCLTCKYVVTPKKDHVHHYGSQWSHDEVGHWHECSGCKNEKDYAAHIYDNGCDDTCNVCSYKRENAHTYPDGWHISNFEHWKVCSECDAETTREKHVPGPAATDQLAQVCIICNFELEGKQEHVHDFGTEWFRTDDTHWQVCSCGEQSVPASHIWQEGQTHRSGTVTYICKDCGMEKEVETSSGGLSGIILLVILLALVCVSGIGALVMILMRNREKKLTVDSEEETVEYNPDSTEDFLS